MKTIDNIVVAAWKKICVTSPISNIRLRTVYQEIYAFGLPKKHSGRKKYHNA